MKAFVRLWYIRGFLNWTFYDIITAYSQEYANKILNATIWIKRFHFLCVKNRFDDTNTRKEHFQQDRVNAAKLSFETFVSNCEKVMVSDVYLSLGEELYATRVVMVFCQNNKSKPAKYGLLFWNINSTEMLYMYSAVFYPAKPPGQPNKHYLTSMDDIVQCLVTNLSNHVNVQGCNTSRAQFYTSIKLKRME